MKDYKELPITEVIEQNEIEHLDYPDWLKYLCEIGDHPELTINDIEAINQGGCDSGAFMPAVTYHTALKAMNEKGDDILNYSINGLDIKLEFDLEEDSWAGFAVRIVSLAVEDWASYAQNVLDDFDFPEEE